jgi:hypothetical protein
MRQVEYLQAEDEDRHSAFVRRSMSQSRGRPTQTEGRISLTPQHSRVEAICAAQDASSPENPVSGRIRVPGVAGEFNRNSL